MQNGHRYSEIDGHGGMCSNSGSDRPLRLPEQHDDSYERGGLLSVMEHPACNPPAHPSSWLDEGAVSLSGYDEESIATAPLRARSHLSHGDDEAKGEGLAAVLVCEPPTHSSASSEDAVSLWDSDEEPPFVSTPPSNARGGGCTSPDESASIEDRSMTITVPSGSAVGDPQLVQKNLLEPHVEMKGPRLEGGSANAPTTFSPDMLDVPLSGRSDRSSSPTERIGLPQFTTAANATESSPEDDSFPPGYAMLLNPICPLLPLELQCLDTSKPYCVEVVELTTPPSQGLLLLPYRSSVRVLALQDRSGSQPSSAAVAAWFLGRGCPFRWLVPVQRQDNHNGAPNVSHLRILAFCGEAV
ncbi:hypothetical protein OF83DRAFT_1180337 [Amylostereum chailletii]|nr:hypothetical protein OF83DRAFT_1180337 [Amylostereum chailletii]